MPFGPRFPAGVVGSARVFRGDERPAAADREEHEHQRLAFLSLQRARVVTSDVERPLHVVDDPKVRRLLPQADHG